MKIRKFNESIDYKFNKDVLDEIFIDFIDNNEIYSSEYKYIKLCGLYKYSLVIFLRDYGAKDFSGLTDILSYNINLVDRIKSCIEKVSIEYKNCYALYTITANKIQIGFFERNPYSHDNGAYKPINSIEL